MAYTLFDPASPDPTTDDGQTAFNKARTNQVALRDALIAGMPGWQRAAALGNGPDNWRPQYWIFSKGIERIRLTCTYGSSGGSAGRITQIVADYSSDNGSTYNDNIGTWAGTWGSDGHLSAAEGDGRMIQNLSMYGLTLDHVNKLSFVGAGTTTLTDAATIQWALKRYQVFQVTLGGDRVMAAPTNQEAGVTYGLFVFQDATGGRTIDWDNAAFRWPGAAEPSLLTAPSAVDFFTFISRGGVMFNTGHVQY